MKKPIRVIGSSLGMSSLRVDLSMLKKMMNIVDLLAWVNENKVYLKGARISNIYSTGKYWFMKIYGGEKLLLKIEPGRRIHFSKSEPSTKIIDKMTAILRKYIRGGIINESTLIDSERIVKLVVTAHKNTYYLYIELLPRGVLVLTTRDNKIIYASRFVEMKDRSIKPRQEYRLPPLYINIFEVKDPEILVKRIRSYRDLIRGVTRGLMIPGEVAEEILYRTGLYELKTIEPTNIDKKDLEILIEEFYKLVEESNGKRGFVVKKDEGEVVSFTPFYPHVYSEIYGFNVVETSSFNEATDIYFTHVERIESEIEAKKVVEEELRRIEKTIEEQKEIIGNYRKRISDLEKRALLLSLKTDYVQGVMKCVENVRRNYGWEKIVEHCQNIVSYDKKQGLVCIRVNEETLCLDVRKSIWDTIKELYKRVGELKHKLKKASAVLEELKKKKEEIASQIKIAGATKYLIKPRMWFENYHWLITSEGFLVIGGRDASQNESLVRKHLEENDVFLHADIHGAPATILKTRGRTPGKKSIEEASVLAACYSKAWKLGFGSIDVFWVKGEQVSKSPPSGEYLGKGSFMIYGKKNYVKNVKLEISVGVEPVYDEVYGYYQRVIVGPSELVKKRSIVYATIIPGSQSIEHVSKTILSKFTEICGKDNIHVNVSDLRERIPGPSRIIGFFKGDRYKDVIEMTT